MSERFFFAHVQKTAGTTLRRRLRVHFGVDAVYPNRSDGDLTAIISLSHLLQRWEARSDEIRVVTGHFPLATIELLNADFTSFTVLREPVARTVSYLRHHRQVTPADRHKPLESIYDDPLRFHGLAHNQMTKMFSLSPTEMESGDGLLSRVDFTPKRLATAKAGLASIDVIGLQERYEDFCSHLSRRFGWDLGDEVHANRSKSDEISPQLLERIREDNAMDAELYEYGQRLVAEREALAD